MDKWKMKNGEKHWRIYNNKISWKAVAQNKDFNNRIHEIDETPTSKTTR